MDPNSGRIYTQAEVEQLDPEIAKNLVTIIGTPELVKRISGAVREQKRRKDKAARKARRVGRTKR